MSRDVLGEGLLLVLGFSGVVERCFTALPVKAILGFVFKHEVDDSPQNRKTCGGSGRRGCCHTQVKQLLEPDSLAHQWRVHLQTDFTVWLSACLYRIPIFCPHESKSFL
jgi:hypothetical protein